MGDYTHRAGVSTSSIDISTQGEINLAQVPNLGILFEKYILS